jgi:hypothetical protein
MLKFIAGLLDKANRKGTIKRFREAKDMLGMPEIEGIENLSDERIMEIYHEVDDALFEIGGKRNESSSLTYQMVDCIVRDRLIDEINGHYNEGLASMKQNCLEGGFSAVFIKGRIYTGLLS